MRLRSSGAGVGRVSPVQRHEEMVAGAGAGDIEQPEPFVVAHLFVDWFGHLELGSLQVFA